MVQLKLSDVSGHLTEEVLQTAFNLRTNSDDKITSIEVMRAAPAGEGLISAVYRVTVIGSHRKTSFVVKGLVNDKLLRRTLNCGVYFNREALFFTKVLPQMLALQKSLNAKESLQNNVPICYGCFIDGKDDYILMEDLTERCCTAISEAPTENERNNTLKVIAHLHAVSMAMKIKNPDVYNDIVNNLTEVYYNKYNQNWYAQYLENAIKIDRDILAEFEDPSKSIYVKKFTKLVGNNVYEQLINLVTRRNKNTVLCHGDAWLPNFLCSKERTVAIDFQLFRCASPATDLSYFILLCSNLCRCKEDFFNALTVYYESLKYYLSDMGFNACDIFSWQELNEEIRQYGKFGLLAALTSIPLLASERCDVLQSFQEKYSGREPERIPLEDLWILTPIAAHEKKMVLVNAVRVAIDVGLI